MVTDGASTCDTTTGGGSYQVFVKVKEDGSGYVAPNCAGGSEGSSQSSSMAAPLASQVTSLGNVMCWGDSLSSGVGGTPWCTQLSTISGVNAVITAFTGITSSAILNNFNSDASRRSWLNAIWSGRNDYNTLIGNPSAFPAAQAAVLANIAAMVSALPAGSDGTKRFVVLSVLNSNSSTGGVEANTGSDYSYFTGLNAALAAAYPDNYVDVRAALVAQYNNASIGCGSSQDLTDHGLDVPPHCLTSVGVHLNSAGYLVVAQTVYAWMQAHGGQDIPTLTNLSAYLNSGAAAAGIRTCSIVIGADNGPSLALPT